MASKNVREINDQNFQDEVLASPEPFLLDFSATWCGPCKALLPIVEKIADENVGAIRVGKIDIDSSPEVAAKLGVRGVPSIVVFKNGKEAARRIGLANRDAIMKLFAG